MNHDATEGILHINSFILIITLKGKYNDYPVLQEKNCGIERLSDLLRSQNW
jgi:hypothetical protein